MAFLEFTFSSIWHFLGIALLMSGIGGFFSSIWKNYWKYKSILKHGYPPATGSAIEKDCNNTLS